MTLDDLIDEKTHHICSFPIETVFNALRSHPSDGDLLLTSLTLFLKEVVDVVDILRLPKICNFDDTFSINPVFTKCNVLLGILSSEYNIIHAVPCCQVTMNKLLSGKILHSFCNVETNPKKCLVGRLYLHNIVICS